MSKIIDSSRLEKTFKITRSNHQSCPLVPCPHVSYACRDGDCTISIGSLFQCLTTFFHEEILPDILSKPSLVQLESVPSHPLSILYIQLFLMKDSLQKCCGNQRKADACTSIRKSHVVIPYIAPKRLFVLVEYRPWSQKYLKKQIFCFKLVKLLLIKMQRTPLCCSFHFYVSPLSDLQS